MNNKFQEYARLLVEVGVNIQKGQTLLLFCPVEHAAFARMCADVAYEDGCREVVTIWSDDHMTRAKYLYAEDAVFTDFPQYRADMFTHYATEKAAFLHLISDDPENLLGVDSDRILNSHKASGAKLKDYRAMQNANRFPWSIGALSSPKWAKKVFPNLPEAEAVEALWEKIFMAVRIQGDGSAVEAWRVHAKRLHQHAKILNGYHFKSLHYTNSLGTDLTVELADTHIWEAGGDVTTDGQEYMPNMPTEECFTAPKANGVNGVVYAAMPLCRDGNVIEDIRFVLRDGKIIEATASKGEDVLRAAISVDAGASHFGEVALVPFDSPISNCKTLFYETLFDENAACHFAFGSAYASNIEGGTHMTKDELIEHGINDSITHVDFMVGTRDLSIVGVTADGREIPVFVDGNFAF